MANAIGRSKLRALAFVSALIVLAIALTSCALTAPQAKHWQDPSHQLIVTVESRPSGAAVYGIVGDNLGVQIGSTPLTIRFLDGYEISGVESNLYCDICKEFDQFLEMSEQKGSLIFFGTDRSYVAFKCAVIKDGFEPYVIRDAILDWSAAHADPFDNPSFHAAFKGVRRHHTAVLQSTTPQAPPVSQQQQQQQTVVVPGGYGAVTYGTINLTCNVSDAEVYLDGAFVGNAPATLKLQEGMHIVEVKASGYGPYRKDVRVLGNSELSLRAELQR